MSALCSLALCILHVLFVTSAATSITVIYELSPAISPSPLRLPSRTPSRNASTNSLDITQKCPSLSPAHCCVPVDISEVSHTSDRQHYHLATISLQNFDSRVNQDLNVWNTENCEGPAVIKLPLSPRRRGGKGSWDAPSNLLISGVSLNSISPSEPPTGEREVQYPSEITYMGGLYYEYIGGGLEYARVSYWGEGPIIIYGMRMEGRGMCL